jgi:DNA-binding MarR family transcriptional regulator
VSDIRIIDDMACNCLMGRARLVARVITNIYDELLLPFGLKASQLNLLVVVAQEGPVRRANIGRLLHLDRSTLTRNLQVMINNDWIAEVQDHSDARGLPLRVTSKGAALLTEVAAAWRKAQRRAEALLGEHGVSVLKNVSGNLLGAG